VIHTHARASSHLVIFVWPHHTYTHTRTHTRTHTHAPSHLVIFVWPLLSEANVWGTYEETDRVCAAACVPMFVACCSWLVDRDADLESAAAEARRVAMSHIWHKNANHLWHDPKFVTCCAWLVVRDSLKRALHSIKRTLLSNTASPHKQTRGKTSCLMPLSLSLSLLHARSPYFPPVSPPLLPSLSLALSLSLSLSQRIHTYKHARFSTSAHQPGYILGLKSNVSIWDMFAKS